MLQQRVEAYLDANAGALFDVDFWIRAFSTQLNQACLGNPSSIHSHGQHAHKWLAEARERVAESVGEIADPTRVVFTSSGTEANQSVLHSAFKVLKPRAWALTAVEHDSVRSMRAVAQSEGIEVIELGVDASGLLSLEALDAALSTKRIGVLSVLWVNNETGVIQPIQEIIAIARKHDVWVHFDAAQAWGKLPIDVSRLGAHWVTFSGHKIGAFPGVGAVWKAPKAPWTPMILGKQESALRGGTENLMGIWSMGVRANELKVLQWQAELGPARDRLEQAIVSAIPHSVINGAQAPRVANTSNISFHGIDGESVVIGLDLEGFSVSAGAACTSGAMHPSHVLLAMGHGPELALASIRLSLHQKHIQWDPSPFVQTLKSVVESMRISK